MPLQQQQERLHDLFLRHDPYDRCDAHNLRQHLEDRDSPHAEAVEYRSLALQYLWQQERAPIHP